MSIEEKCLRCGHHVSEATYESGRKWTECLRCRYELMYELSKMSKTLRSMPQCPTCKPKMYGKYFFGTGTTILSRDCKSIICIWCGKEAYRLPEELSTLRPQNSAEQKLNVTGK